MKKHYPLQSIIKLFILLFILQGCFNTQPKQPNVLFDASRVGDIFSFDFEVRESDVKDHNYFVVVLRAYNDEKFAQKKKKQTLESATKLLSYFPESILEAKFDISIINKQSLKIEYSEIIENKYMSAGGGGRSAYLALAKLNPGIYKVNIKYIQGNPKLQDLYMVFTMYKRYYK